MKPGLKLIKKPEKVSPNRGMIRVAAAARIMASSWQQTGKNIKGYSVVGCGRWRAYGADPTIAEIKVDHKGPRFTGHFCCKAVWSCDSCAKFRVAQTRGWIRAALIPAAVDQGLTGSLVTLTLSHQYDEDWALVVARLFDAFTLTDRRMGKHYPKIGALGKFKSLEAPVGKNGIHPHLHLLLIHKKDVDAGVLEDFVDAMGEAWDKAVVECGGSTNDRGFDFQENRLNTYAAKKAAAHEMASHGTKNAQEKGLMLEQLLDRAARGDKKSEEEWLRAQKALGGRMRFHAGGLPKKLGICSPSAWEDEEFQAELEADRAAHPDPVVISYPLHRHLHATPSRSKRAALAMILRSARSADRQKVVAMVDVLCAEVDRNQADRDELAWVAQAGEREMLEVLKIASERPMTRAEVLIYLAAKKRGLVAPGAYSE